MWDCRSNSGQACSILAISYREGSRSCPVLSIDSQQHASCSRHSSLYRGPTFILIAQQHGCLVHEGTCLLGIQLLQGPDSDPGSKALQDEGNALGLARGH